MRTIMTYLFVNWKCCINHGHILFLRIFHLQIATSQKVNISNSSTLILFHRYDYHIRPIPKAPCKWPLKLKHRIKLPIQQVIFPWGLILVLPKVYSKDRLEIYKEVLSKATKNVNTIFLLVLSLLLYENKAGADL